MQVDFDQLKKLFEKMQEDGFNTDVILKWGFYFFNREEEGLKRVIAELADHDYHVETFERSRDDWKLYITKVEILNPDKLYWRNIAFNKLAEYCNVDVYDGWDVEKIK